MQRLAATFLFGLAFPALYSGPAFALKVDVHAHAELSSTAGKSPSELTAAMAARGLDKVILMTVPSPLPSISTYDTSDIASFFSAEISAGQVYLMYGGDELNNLLHAMGREDQIPGPDRWDADGSTDAVYPNSCTGGCPTAIQDAADDAALIEAEGPAGATYNTFIGLAQNAADSGLYLGFGEIGALHLSRRTGHPYINFPVNHDWMKDLADIAEGAGMVIDLHYELSDSNKADLADLLNHNTNVKFIMEHGGWSTYGDTNGHAVIRELLEAHPNLYVALKKCDSFGIASCYHDSANAVGTDWESLILDHYDRFMFGSDAKYWQDSSYTVQQTMDLAFRDRSLGDGLGSLRILRNHIRGLNPTAAEWLEGGTAMSVFGIYARGRNRCGGSPVCRGAKKPLPWAWRKALRG